MYHERMLNYYPQAIQDIEEFQAIVDGECPEVEEIKTCVDSVIADAYWSTMSEERVEEWEKLLTIRPVVGSTLENRRDTIIARLRGQGKLNTKLIKTIVSTFTNAECNTWIENSTLYVHLLPPQNGKNYILDNVIQELSLKVPAHLKLVVDRAWQSWGDLNSKYTDWAAVRQVYGTWEDVLFDSQTKANQLDYSTLDSLRLG
jgi:hypothetical protein